MPVSTIVDNLRAFLDLDSDALDDSGSSRDFTNTGSATFDGTYASFNGSSQTLSRSSFGLSRTAFTLSLWFNRNSNSGRQQLAACDSDSTGRSWLLDLFDGGSDNLLFAVVISGSFTKCSTSTTPSASALHHVVVSYDGSNLRLYLDGVLKTKTACTGTLDSGGPTYLGGREYSSARDWYDGKQRCAGFWDRALSDGGVTAGSTAGGEVAFLYSSGTPLKYADMVVTTGAGSASGASTATAAAQLASPGINLVIDSDLWSDPDDAGAMAIAHHLCDTGETCILSLTGAMSPFHSLAALDAINYWYGRTNVPLGKNPNTLTGPAAALTAPVAIGCPNGVIAPSPVITTAVDRLRTALHNADDGSVTLASIGGCTNLSDLLNSASDAIDSRNGSDLITAKVAATVIMGGSETTGTEYNFALAPAAAHDIAANWPVPITFLPGEAGSDITNVGNLTAVVDARSPVRTLYELRNGPSTSSMGAWDTQAILYAVRGNVSSWYTTTTGTNAVNASTGANTFTAGAGTHTMLHRTVGANTPVGDALQTLIATAPVFGAPPAYTYYTHRQCRLPFEEGTGSSAADSSGNSRNATLHGSAGWASGQVGSKALDLSAGGYASVPDDSGIRPTVASDYSVALWTRTPASVPASNQLVVGKSRASGNYWSLYINSSKVFQYAVPGLAFNISGVVSNATWYHLIILQKSGWRIAFLNGVPLTDLEAAADSDGTGELDFGGYNAGANDPYTGRVDDFQLFWIGLSYAEAQRVYAGAPDPGGISGTFSNASGPGTITVNGTAQTVNVDNGRGTVTVTGAAGAFNADNGVGKFIVA